MGIVRWAKKHPWEAAALAAAAVATGGAALAPEAAAAGAGTLALETGGPALLGADVATGASLGAEAAAGGAGMGSSALLAPVATEYGLGGAGESAALSGLPATEYGLGGAGESMLLAPTEYGLGGGASGLTGQYAGSAESSLYGPNAATNPAQALDSRSWWDKFAADKLKDPKTVMHLGMMAAQLGAPHGGPAPMQSPPQMRQAQMTQEDITKKWLMQNDPNTYRRIYGNPQGVA